MKKGTENCLHFLGKWGGKHEKKFLSDPFQPAQGKRADGSGNCVDFSGGRNDESVADVKPGL